MPTVKCYNDVSIQGRIKGCNKYLVILPPSVISALKENPNDKLTLRCHDCPGETKWIDVYYNQETGYTWSIHDGEIDFDGEGEMVFDTVLKSSIIKGEES